MNKETARRNALTVFYAWQSDLPEYTNRGAIRKALRALRSPLEHEFVNLSLDIEIDEATRDVPGSPHIPQTVLAKIAKSHVFVGDISLINQGTPTDSKKTPNPNVLFELGYAVAMLGWSRIILLFNREFGDPKDLPFDIDRQRVSFYRIKEPSDNPSPLQSLCSNALKTIISQNPSRPSLFDAASTQRSRDLQTMESLFHSIHWPVVEAHLRSAPRMVSDPILIFWDFFRGVRESPTFHLYDKKLLRLVDDFRNHWHETIKFSHRYESKRRSNGYVFKFSGVEKIREQEERDFGYIEGELLKLETSMRRLLDYLKHNYIELDLKALSDAAWREYQEENIRIRRLFRDI
jgi:hypothetical protein